MSVGTGNHVLHHRWCPECRRRVEITCRGHYNCPEPSAKKFTKFYKNASDCLKLLLARSLARENDLFLNDVSATCRVHACKNMEDHALLLSCSCFSSSAPPAHRHPPAPLRSIIHCLLHLQKAAQDTKPPSKQANKQSREKRWTDRPTVFIFKVCVFTNMKR